MKAPPNAAPPAGARGGEYARRLFDVVFSVVVLTLTLPLLMVIAVLIACTMGRPVLFTQTRSGLGGKPFRIVKFRTMRTGEAVVGDQVSDAARLTRLGRTLRSSSLDEFPAFLNVILGHMSVVGPRPLLPEYLPLYSARQSRRHLVRPGITGWAQVNGRNLLSWRERLELDVWYVEHRTFLLDLRIVALTVLHVFRRTGISAAGAATMPRFTGDAETE